MTTELDNLQAELILAGIQCNVTYGDPISTPLTRENVANGRLILFFPTLDTESEQMTWQGSPLVTLRGSITSYHTSDKNAVNFLHSSLVTLGFKRENGDVGRPPKMPIDSAMGTLKILWIKCPGGVRMTAQPAGDIWAVEQSLELAFYKP